MENVFSYLKWRGDLDFNTSGFNSIDNIIFSALSYLKLNIKEDEILNLEEAYQRYTIGESSSNIFYMNVEKLFTLVQESKRFKNVKIARYKRIIDKSVEEQFGAVTFILPNDTLYIAFSGTDESVVGWKENFNLSFLEKIPAQEEAKFYLEDILNHTKKKIFVGGHSKGGNLAMYAVIFCRDDYKNKIIQTFNNDGPGLPEEVFSTKEFLEIKEKIISYLPKFGVIGYLFSNKTQIKFIESYQIGILEHDLFSWKVNGTDFIFVDDLNKLAKDLVKKFNNGLKDIPKEKRKRIINLIYDLLLNFKIENLDDLFAKITDFPAFIKKYNLDFENIELILNLLGILFQIFKIL